LKLIVQYKNKRKCGSLRKSTRVEMEMRDQAVTTGRNTKERGPRRRKVGVNIGNPQGREGASWSCGMFIRNQ